jgi:hypothetical protein
MSTKLLHEDEAALYAITVSPEYAEYVEKEYGVTKDNLHELNKKYENHAILYEIAAEVGGVLLQKIKLCTNEELFRVLSKAERRNIGDRIFIGEKACCTIPGGTRTRAINKMLKDMLDHPENENDT